MKLKIFKVLGFILLLISINSCVSVTQNGVNYSDLNALRMPLLNNDLSSAMDKVKKDPELLNKKYNFNNKGYYIKNMNLLQYSLFLGNVEFAKYLINNNLVKDINYVAHNGIFHTTFFAVSYEPEILKLLIKNGLDVTLLTGAKENSLHEILANNILTNTGLGINNDSFEFLLKTNININQKNINGTLPLDYALKYNKAFVPILLAYGAKAEKNISNKYAIELAIEYNNLSALKILIQKNKSSKEELLNLLNDSLENPSVKEETLFEFLKLTKNIDSNLVKKVSLTRALKANRSSLMLDKLIKMGASLEKWDDKLGNTPITYAISNIQDTETVINLLKRTNHIKKKFNSGDTYMHYATFYKRNDLIPYLYSKGLSFDGNNVKGNSPFLLLFKTNDELLGNTNSSNNNEVYIDESNISYKQFEKMKEIVSFINKSDAYKTITKEIGDKAFLNLIEEGVSIYNIDNIGFRYNKKRLESNNIKPTTNTLELEGGIMVSNFDEVPVQAYLRRGEEASFDYDKNLNANVIKYIRYNPFTKKKEFEFTSNNRNYSITYTLYKEGKEIVSLDALISPNYSSNYGIKAFPTKIKTENEEISFPQNYFELNPFSPELMIQFGGKNDKAYISNARPKWVRKSKEVMALINNYLLKTGTTQDPQTIRLELSKSKIYPATIEFIDHSFTDKENQLFVQNSYFLWLKKMETVWYQKWEKNKNINIPFTNEEDTNETIDSLTKKLRNSIFSENSLIDDIKKGKDYTSSSYDGYFEGNDLINYAVVRNYSKLIDILIQKKFDLNKFNKKGQTPTHNAIIYERLNILKKLIKGGANIEILDKHYYETPLMAAVRYNQYKYVDLLLNEGADINTVNNKGLTALENELRFHKKYKKELPLFAILELIKKGAKVPKEYEYILNQYNLYKILMHKKEI